MFIRFLLLILLLLIPSAIPASSAQVYDLEVTFDIPSSKIKGIAVINVQKGNILQLHTGSLDIAYINFNNQPVVFKKTRGTVKFTPEKDGTVEVGYTGIFSNKNTGDIRNDEIVQNLISSEGISLTGVWYPVTDDLRYYRLKALLPKGYTAISEADTITTVEKEKTVEYSFDFPHPVNSINFNASGRFVVLKETFGDIDIYAYFFKEDIEIAKTYMQFTKKYLKLYEALIDKYPYRRFTVVENFLQTGYSMPTFTLLGSAVVRLPFIQETSLGHEILHQWFGNHVYVDYEKGNWAEGLTTYLADHFYEEQNKKGWEYRKQMLSDYKSYVTSENEFPVGKFSGRLDRSSRAIGYGKVAMIFHMLRNMLGDKKFHDALKHFIAENRFRKASWDDLKTSFEKFYGRDMEWFFSQWIKAGGMPKIEVADLVLKQTGSGYSLDFVIRQTGRAYELVLPVNIYTQNEQVRKNLKINAAENKFSFTVASRPDKISFDEDYDVARDLESKEFAPVIARLLGDSGIMLALPAAGREKYESIIKYFSEKGAVLKKSDDIGKPDIEKHSIVILDNSNLLTGRLFGQLPSENKGFEVKMMDNPWNSGHVVGILHGESRNEVDVAFNKIFHYGKYSNLLFEKGRNIKKDTAPTSRGIVRKLSEEPSAVDLSEIKTLTGIINNVAKKKVIYIGEVHDVFAHHAVQLDVIKGVHQKTPKIAIGMEMFQRPFQETLDSFIAGVIDEKEFLKKTEYFKRWGFDYNLYKPILDFAKSEKLPVIALNMQREIIDRISKNGIDSLSETEKKKVPDKLDFSDSEYRERLTKIFELHANREEKNFDFFYQSQIIWDETMSQSIDDFLSKNPDYKMIVIAGRGHLEYGSGIPKRTYRRNRLEHSIILIDAEVEKGIADYVVFPKPVEGITTPKLMVFLKIADKMFEISGFPPDSVSEKAGLKTGDIILAIDGDEVNSMDDIKIRLFYRKVEDIISVRVLRKDGDTEKKLNFEVKL